MPNEQTRELVAWLIDRACKDKATPSEELLTIAREKLSSIGLERLFALFFKVEYGDTGDLVPEYTEVCGILYPELRLVETRAA